MGNFKYKSHMRLMNVEELWSVLLKLAVVNGATVDGHKTFVMISVDLIVTMKSLLLPVMIAKR